MLSKIRRYCYSLLQRFLGSLNLAEISYRRYVTGPTSEPLRWTSTVFGWNIAPVFPPQRSPDHQFWFSPENGLTQIALFAWIPIPIRSGVVQQVVRILANNLFLRMTCHLRQGVIAEGDGSFRVDSADGLNQRIQDELMFRVEFVNHKCASARLPQLCYRRSGLFR